MLARRFVLYLVLFTLSTYAASPPIAATQPGVTDKLPHIQVDVKSKSVRVECESCNAHQDVGLEFFCVTTGGNEYESVLRTDAKPSNIHLALLMVGLKPGEPVKYSEAAKKWIPPHGPPLTITCEWTDKSGKLQRVPAYRLMRNNKTKKEPQPFTWVFVGSQIMEDGKYGADATGYIVSVLNSSLAVIDLPQLVGTALETRELDRNSDLLPEAGQRIWMVIEPAGKNDVPKTETPADDLGETVVTIDPSGKVSVDGMTVPVDRIGQVLSNRRVKTKARISAATGAPAATVQEVNNALREAKVPLEGTSPAAGGISDVHTDDELMKKLREKWEKAVAPHDKALREAAQAHYEVIESMRREQQRLIDEADRIQRVIDELQKQYQEMTTPRPETEK